MPGLLPDVDPNGLVEYSVVYTDRSVNHMSLSFREVMTDISSTLKEVYNADAVAVVPGSGTFGMEAVARQFATNQNVMVIRNGWFSYRWTQILEMGSIASSHTVSMANPVRDEEQASFAPPDLDLVLTKISEEKPKVVFAPHVETSAGMLLPDSYIRQVADATHQSGGIMVLDCIASGALWVDMKKTGVDVIVSAPQKGWSGTPCCALVMMSQRALDMLQSTESSSFACDLKKWREIMEAYEKGGHAYHATMPTDGLKNFRDVMKETQGLGFEAMKEAQIELGNKIRAVLEENGYKSVAADGYKSPGVIVSYTNDPAIKSGAKFSQAGMQIAGGVPLKCGEPEDFSTFRIGLFGLDKLTNIQRTVETFSSTLSTVQE
ncbi:MAG: aminotransferase class V-fold PLP-dependent enzyme [Actinomycetota bacterium]|nr:aminotransferase class V-fold PLP-dependent enzyme [Actinomycetota bacterium]MEC7578030.1 aminotransferase class V-fold PLP-dependent enzyme [Actinomycetota bacterium]MEC8119639.1 aminotransferase class V-fold PLP-dependent enzyme [Actinomycetota bacterium]MEC8334581.1 aminotransferase class V-fold PLP-dependent enzyme [Actinomycetota bacterium]MEC8364918.1 aminotransferase class V-fold PLP-dependent enzyme [Actinomycetota bacterium]